KSLVTYSEMRRESTAPPDSFSFAFILKATANLKSLRVGFQLHCRALAHGLDTHLFVGTTLISMYAECECFGFAQKVFEEMFEPNVVAWNAVVNACFRCDDVKGAEKMFKRMPFRNVMLWNVMLAGYTKVGELILSNKLFHEMPMKDDVYWSSMIVGFAHSGFFE
ncbi:Pentatricopeptide repeat-containing protein, partial [Sarracenia purpurea var. burkii]